MIHNTLLSLKLPGGETITGPDGLKPEFTDLASFLSPLLQIVFYIAAFLAFYFLIWGAFQYIMSQGNKENLAKARARITWALIGLIIVFLSYFLARFGSEVFKPGIGGVPF